MTSRQYNFDTTTERKDSNAVAQHGFKSYIFTEAQIAEFKYPDEELIPLWIADMAFPAAPEIVEAIKQRLDNPIFGYTKILDDSFYKAFVNWTRSRYDWEFAQQELLTTSGVIPALYSLIEYICEAGDKVITFTPAYSYFKRSADYHNIDIVYSPLLNEQNDYRMDFDDFRKKARDPKVKVCIFCHPHN